MKYIPQGETVNVNDIVLTSGLGGNFPKKLIIGQVTAVHQRDIDMFQEAHIRPTVDFNNLEIVLVITNFPLIIFEKWGR
jgi:rod shape-determining protein MreC